MEDIQRNISKDIETINKNNNSLDNKLGLMLD